MVEMNATGKRMILFYLLAAAIAVVLIAAGLPRLVFKPGIPLPGLEGGLGALPDEPNPFIAISINTFFMAVLGLILALIVVYGAYKMILGAPWKEILRASLFIVVLTLGLMAVIMALSRVHVTTELPQVEHLPPPLRVSGPPLGPMPPFLIWLVWIFLAGVVVLLGVWLYAWRSRSSQPGDRLGWEAEQALLALNGGQDLGNVILRCYRQMSLVLQSEQGIEREEAMTAREFERLLEARGVPNPPVHQLTRLFEAARYGNWQPTADDEQNAAECLRAIVTYCRRQPGKRP
jgi:hypothetical protein